MSNHDLLEAAFRYAESGMARTVQDVRRHLLGLGYSQRDLQQLVGVSLANQLSRLIQAAMHKDDSGNASIASSVAGTASGGTALS